MNQEISFGSFVRQRRREMDLTQEELARRVGCAAITLRKIEADDLRPSVQIAERLAMALAVPLDDRADFVRRARAVHPEASDFPAITPSPTLDEIGREDLTGRAIRGYALAERIGMGGFGSVYRAVQPNVEREVAVKIILPAFANHPDFIRRFEAEAQLVARLEHPHIVPLYDYWREPGVAYLVMRLLRGGNVQALLGQGPLLMDTTTHLLEQICSALNAAHRIGVIHRDLKPANVLLDEDGNAYLADFGIAKNVSNPDLEHQTQIDEMVGTPHYMSPEQIRSLTIKPQTDVYCLGIMLYEMLTGALPFAGPTPFDLIQQHINVPMPPLAAHHTGLPAALDAVIGRATAKNPEDRYEDVLVFFKDFRQAAGSLLNERPTLIRVEEETDVEMVNPFKGLRAFSEADAENFFGRETLVQQLLARLGEGGDLSRFLAVIGPSGSGKSSVVRAGLIPALRRGGLPGSENWFIVDMLPGKHPFEELEASLLRVAVNPPEHLLSQMKDGTRGLLRAVHRILPADESVELVLVIDQFEEVFTLIEDEAERALLLENLAAAMLDERSRLHVIITLRADFTDKPLRYVDFGELMNRRFEFILPLTPDELERAVLSPAQRVGLKLEKGLVSTIIREVGNQPGALPLLQFALSELFDKRDGRTLTTKAYQEIGGVLGALGRSAEAIYANQDEAGQSAARQLFLRLVTLGEGTEDTRRRVLREEIESLHEDQQSAIQKVIEIFGKSRLLSFDRDPITRGPTIEVAHEALIREWPKLREWLSQDRGGIIQHRHLTEAAHQWELLERDAGSVYRGARLAQANEWSALNPNALNAQERLFLDASNLQAKQEEQEHEDQLQRELNSAKELAETQRQSASRLRTRNRVITTVGTIAIILALLAGTFGVQSNRNALQADQNARAAINAEAVAVANADAAQKAEAEAIRQQRLTLSRELAGNAIINLDVDPERSILLAMQAVSTTYSVDGTTTKEAGEGLHRAVLNSRLRLTLQGDGYGLAFSPDGKQIVTSGRNGEIKLWDLQSRTELFTLLGHEGIINSVAFSPDGSRLASASGDGTAKVWDLDTQQVIHNLRGHTDEVYSVAFSKDGTRIVTASIDGTARVWDAVDGQLLLTFTGHEAPVISAQFNPDGTRIVTTGDDVTARVWDSSSGQEIYRLSDFVFFVNSAIFSPDGKILATTARGEAKLWDAETGKQLFLLPGSINSGVPAFSPDGKYVAVGGQDGMVSMWETATGQQYLTFGTGTPVDAQIEFSPGCVAPPTAPYTWCGMFLATGNRDGLVRLWDITPTGSREVMTVPSSWNCLAPDGTRLHTGSAEGSDGQIHTWQFPELTSVVEPSNVLTPPGQELSSYPAGEGVTLLTSAFFTPDCSRNAVIDRTNLIATISDMESGKQLLQFKLAEGTPSFFAPVAFSLSPDGTRFATAGPGNTGKVYDLANGGRELLTLEGHTAVVITLAFSPDGKQIATTSEDKSVKLWDAETGQELRTFTRHTHFTSRVVFSPDGTRLASGSFDRTVKVWDIQTGQELLTLSGHIATVWGIAFSPDGISIATGSNDNTLRLWDVRTGEPLLTLPTAAPAFRISFTPDSTRLVVSIINGETRVYLPRIEDLLALAKSRVTRTLTLAECQQYLHMDACPASP